MNLLPERELFAESRMRVQPLGLAHLSRLTKSCVGELTNSNIHSKRLHSHADRSTQTSLNHPCASRSDRPPPRTYLPAATGILQPRPTSGRRAKRHMTARSPLSDKSYPFLNSRRSALAAYHLLPHEFDTLCRESVIET